MRGRIYGLKIILTFGAGMGSGTALSGWISEDSGLKAVFTVAACFAAAALLMAGLARALKPRDQNTGGGEVDTAARKET